MARRTRLLQSIRIGLSSLTEHPLRTLLSTTGVVIGVLALVATFAVTDGVDRWSRFLIERESSVQDVVVSTRREIEVDGRRQPLHHVPVFTVDDWHAASGIPHVVSAVLTVTGTSSVGTKTRRSTLLTASTANLPLFGGPDVSEGRYFSAIEVDRDADVIVINSRLAGEIAAPHTPRWLLGRTIRVGESHRKVIGILAPRPGETDLAAFVPVGRRFQADAVGDAPLQPVLRFKAVSVERVPQARDAVIDWLAQRFPKERQALDVSVGLERLERAEQAILLTKLIFGLLVILMLAIGGIGIMNVLLASVAERTREIGIRKAVGARGRDVIVHFLAESVAIAVSGSAIGALCGAGLAVGASSVFRHFTGAVIYPEFTAVTIAYVIVAALIVGVAFGTYPARVAARLTPVQAIQRE
jgi:putative ABC transport system permease protein